MATPQNSSFNRRGMRINRMMQTTINDLQTTRLQSRYRLRDRGTPMVQREADLQINFDVNNASMDSGIYQQDNAEIIKKSAATLSKQMKSRSITPSYAYGYGEISLHKDNSFANRSTFKNIRYKMSIDRDRFNQSVKIQLSPKRICIEDYIKSSKDVSRLNQSNRRRNVTIKNNFIVPPSQLPANYVYKPAHAQRSNTPILKYITRQ